MVLMGSWSFNWKVCWMPPLLMVLLICAIRMLFDRYVADIELSQGDSDHGISLSPSESNKAD